MRSKPSFVAEKRAEALARDAALFSVLVPGKSIGDGITSPAEKDSHERPSATAQTRLKNWEFQRTDTARKPRS